MPGRWSSERFLVASFGEQGGKHLLERGEVGIHFGLDECRQRLSWGLFKAASAGRGQVEESPDGVVEQVYQLVRSGRRVDPFEFDELERVEGVVVAVDDAGAGVDRFLGLVRRAGVDIAADCAAAKSWWKEVKQVSALVAEAVRRTGAERPFVVTLRRRPPIPMGGVWSV